MRKLKRGLLFLFVLGNMYGILSGGLYFFQENMIFRPSKLSQEYTFRFDYPFEEKFIERPDGARLHGIHFKSKNPKGVLLYFHGNAGDLQRWGTITEFFVKKQYDVIVMDYRQYGKSTGALSEEAMYADSEAWYAYAISNYSASQITVYGRSLGTTFATYIASRYEAKNLVLETPFYSVEHEAKNRFPVLPVSRLLKYKFPTYRFVEALSIPVTVFHGTDDGVVAYAHGKKLYAAIKSDQKEFITIDGGGHNDLVAFPEYLHVIDEVLARK